MPNNLIHWELIKWSMKEEYSYYDLGGARREKHGPSEIKRIFGGEYKEKQVYSIILKPFKSKIIDNIKSIRVSKLLFRKSIPNLDN